MRTERIELRRFRAGDVDDLRAAYDEVVVTAQGWPPEALDHLERWVKVRRAMPFNWVVVDRSTGRVVGDISVRLEGGFHLLGVSLGPDGRGRGFGSDAVSIVVDRMLGHTGGWIVIDTAEGNVAMRRIAEREGFELLGSFVDMLPNGMQDASVRYSLPISRALRRQRRRAAASGSTGRIDPPARPTPDPPSAPTPDPPSDRS